MKSCSSPQTLVNREMYPAMRLYEHRWFTYGLGWFQTDYGGRVLDFHSGSIDGLVALHGLVRKERLGVYILANRDHAEVRHALMYRALDLFDPRVASGERRDWNREVKDLFDGLEAEQRRSAKAAEAEQRADPRPALERTVYAGRYTDDLAGEIEVLAVAKDLELTYGARTCTLVHRGGDWFGCVWKWPARGETGVQFVASRPGAVGALRFAGLELRARRVTPGSFRWGSRVPCSIALLRSRLALTLLKRVWSARRGQRSSDGARTHHSALSPPSQAG